jgi:hypothetical protein
LPVGAELRGDGFVLVSDRRSGIRGGVSGVSGPLGLSEAAEEFSEGLEGTCRDMVILKESGWKQEWMETENASKNSSGTTVQSVTGKKRRGNEDASRE